MNTESDDIERWQAWDRFVAGRADTGFMQSSRWANCRSHVGYEHFAVILRDGDAIVGGALVGKCTYDEGHCFYYIQEGPVIPRDEDSAAEVFAAVLDGVKRHAQAEGQSVSHLRIEPRWQTLPRFVKGFRQPEFTDCYREPRHTLCVDLRASEDDMLARMKKNGRYNIRIARKHGVVVTQDNTERGVADFLRIQRRTVNRQRIGAKPPSYFRSMMSELGATGNVSLFFAEYRGRRLATALVVTFGPRATYFFGGSLVLHRNVKAPDLLVFEMMRWAKARGYEWFDLWGVAPPDQPEHPWQHLSAFKRKFGGVEVGLVPTLDYVLDAGAYDRYCSIEGTPEQHAAALAHDVVLPA